MKITPNGNRVLVEKRPVPDYAGIILPQGVSEAFTLHVIDVGDGYRLDNGTMVPVPFKAGDEVVSFPSGIIQLPSQIYGGKDYCVIDVGAIVCKVERDGPVDGIGKTIIKGKIQVPRPVGA